MNPLKLPKDSFYARKEILQSNMDHILSKTAEYIHQSYPSLTKLLLAETFCKHELMDAPSARIDHMQKVAFFPWVESSKELDAALSLVLSANYKNVYDCLRRSIELVVSGAYFVLDTTELNKARNWMDSDKGTPNFKRVVVLLGQEDTFLTCNENNEWETKMMDIYWRLCDVIHVKGVSYSFNEIAPKYNSFNGINQPSFHEESCRKALDLFIETVAMIALTIALSNPLLLIGFELDVKFGLNPPASGFFYPAQAERLKELIPNEFQKNIEELIETDPNIQCITDWFESLPDITEEEIERQASEMGF